MNSTNFRPKAESRGTLFFAGATGYIGSSAAVRLVRAGYRVRGLARTPESASALQAIGIEPVHGTLDDLDLMAREARQADAVINTADAFATAALDTFARELAGTGKTLIHTTGAAIVTDDAEGLTASPRIHTDTSPVTAAPGKEMIAQADQYVLAMAGQGIRAIVIAPCMVYGTSTGLDRVSIQLPALIEPARAPGMVRIVGTGVNLWSYVHVADLADLYVLAVSSPAAHGYYFAQQGEVSMAEIGQAIAQRLALGPVQSLSIDKALEVWDPFMARAMLGSNCRVRADRAVTELGWTPRHPSVIDWILTQMPTTPEHSRDR